MALWVGKIFGATFLALGSASAYALYTPQPCGVDPHVQCAVYDPNEVYQIATDAGQGALILLEPGEVIIDNGAAMGDGKAWHMAVSKAGILLKPAAENPDTNLMVITNLRHYTFSLVTAKKKQATTWVLSFDYPDTRDRQADDAAKIKAAHHDTVAGIVKSSKSAKKNSRYMMRGDAALAPTAIWDDGRFTYFEYATARELPAGIYSIGPDGSEAVPDRHMDGDTIVIHETDKQFNIRSGKAVLGIRNDGYSPDGEYNASGTTLPNTVRVEVAP